MEFITFDEFKGKVQDLFNWEIKVEDIAFHLFFRIRGTEFLSGIFQHQIHRLEDMLKRTLEHSGWNEWYEIYVNRSTKINTKIVQLVDAILDIHAQCVEKSLRPGGRAFHEARENFETLARGDAHEQP